MARPRPAEELWVLREEFLVRANTTFDQMFGQDGKNGRPACWRVGDIHRAGRSSLRRISGVCSKYSN